MSQSRPPVYLDSSSAEPLLPVARDAWIEAQDAGWGDPNRLHRPGRLAAQALDRAREVTAATVGARPDEVVFTSSGTLAAHAAVQGLALGRRRVGDRIVTTAVDHSAVLAAAKAAGQHVTVGVDRLGRVDLDEWTASVAQPGTALAVLQVANHEVGTRQPWLAAIEAAAAGGVPVVLDATAALGRLDLSGIPERTAVIGSAAAFGGPASVGYLVLKRGVRWRAPFPPDDNQQGRWPGPPDVPAIHAATAALAEWLTNGAEIGVRQHRLVARLRAGIAGRVPDVDLAGDPDDRVPQLLTFSALYVDGEALTLALDRAGFAVASGSACSAYAETPSHVLAAMGVLTHGNVRLGLTRSTTEADVDAFLDALPPIVAELRRSVGL